MADLFRQGAWSRLLRGPVRRAEADELETVLRELPARHGLAFADASGRIRHELYPGAREKAFETLWRNPLLEVRRAFDRRALRSLVETLRRLSQDPDRGSFVGALTWEHSPRTGVLRLREIARDAGRSTPATTDALLESCRRVALALGARKIVLQTHPAFGAKLLARGWRLDAEGSTPLVRLGAYVQGDRCYGLELPAPGEPVAR